MPRRFRSFSSPHTRKSRSKKRLPLGCMVLLLISASIFLFISKVFEKPPSSDSRVKEVGSYSVGKRTRSVLLVPPGLNRQELIALAREIHARHPEGEFDLFDDGSQMAAYLWHRQNTLDAYITLGKMRYAYPEQFVRSHRVGVIQMVHDKTDGHFKWRLTNGLVDSLVVENSANTIVDLE